MLYQDLRMAYVAPFSLRRFYLRSIVSSERDRLPDRCRALRGDLVL